MECEKCAELREVIQDLNKALDEVIADLEADEDEIDQRDAIIDDLEKAYETAHQNGLATFVLKDTRIAELERELRAFNRPFDDPSGRYDLTNEEWSKQ